MESMEIDENMEVDEIVNLHPTLQDRVLFHESIKDGEEEEVEEFFRKFPNEKHAYNSQYESAVATAIKLNRLEFYETLITRGFSLGPNEDIKDISKINEPMLKKIFKIHKKCATFSEHNHLIILRSKCKLIHTTLKWKQEEFYQKIMQALEELNQIEWIKPLLKIAACSNALKFLFDFNRETVDEIDPRKHDGVYGVTYLKDSYITIGAKSLLDNNRSKVHGTFSHEICHFTMQLVYENNYRPYGKNDVARQQKFDCIVELCREKGGIEEIVDRVFDYDEDKWTAELIVRVPQIIAFYAQDVKKLEEIWKTFKELFQFFEIYVLPDLISGIPLVESKFKVNEINEISGVLSSLVNSKFSLKPKYLNSLNFKMKYIQVLSTNCVHLTMIAIHQKLQIEKNLPLEMFVKLEMLKNKKVFSLIAEIFAKPTKVEMFVDCVDETVETIIEMIEKLRQSNLSQQINFICKKCEIQGVIITQIDHLWSQLSQDTQQKLNKSKVNFQGKELNLEEISNKFEDSHELPLDALLSGIPIKVGNELVFNDIEVYVERTFLFPGAELIDQDPWTNDIELTIDDVINHLELINIFDQKRIVLISELPGMGKTTIFKVIALRMKERFPSNWIVFIELKEFIPFYQRDERISANFNNRQFLVKFLSEKILKLQNFAAKAFKILFDENRIVFFLDGFDEVAPGFKKFIIKLMNAILKFSKNQIWISTRQQFANELRKKFNAKEFWLKRLTKEDRKKFFAKYLESKQIDQESFNRCLIEVENFCSSHEKHPKDDDMFYNPLLIRMVAELLDDDLAIELTTSNYHTIFNQFVNKMIDQCMLKGSVARSSIAYQTRQASVQDFYYKHALLNIFWYKDEAEQLYKFHFPETCQLSPEEIIRVGITCDAGCTTPFVMFVHRSFAEFYVAEFLTKKIFFHESCSDEMLELAIGVFIKVISRSEHKMINKFIEGALESYEIRHNEKMKRVQRFFGKVCDSQFSLSLILSGLVSNESMALMKLITNVLIVEIQQLFDVILDITFYTAFLRTSIEFLRHFLDFCGEKFQPEQMKSLMVNFFKKLNEQREYLEEIECEINQEKFELMCQKARMFMSEDELSFSRNFFNVRN
jgi:NACHT domain